MSDRTSQLARQFIRMKLAEASSLRTGAEPVLSKPVLPKLVQPKLTRPKLTPPKLTQPESSQSLPKRLKYWRRVFPYKKPSRPVD